MNKKFNLINRLCYEQLSMGLLSSLMNIDSSPSCFVYDTFVSYFLHTSTPKIILFMLPVILYSLSEVHLQDCEFSESGASFICVPHCYMRCLINACRLKDSYPDCQKAQKTLWSRYKPIVCSRRLLYVHLSQCMSFLP